MANIIKSSSGLLFAEEAWDDLSLLWDLSPNYPSRVALASDSISLLPGTDRFELLIPAPLENGYVFQSKVEYSPVTELQKAGNTLKSVTDTSVDFEICGDDVITCDYTKISISQNYILNAKASADGILWKDYGNSKITNMNYIGYYIEAGEDTDVPIKVYNCHLYRNNTVTINNFDRTNLIKLFDSTGTEVTDKFSIKKKNSQMCIDGTNLLFPIDYLKVQVLDRTTGIVYHESELTDIYGGDIYEYNYNIEFYIDENKLTTNTYDLGSISNEKVFMLKVTNKESYPIKEKKLRVDFYSVYNPGYKMAMLAPDGTEDYSKTLDVEFLAGETKIFKLKMARNPSLSNVEDEYKFNIILE